MPFNYDSSWVKTRVLSLSKHVKCLLLRGVANLPPCRSAISRRLHAANAALDTATDQTEEEGEKEGADGRESARELNKRLAKLARAKQLNACVTAFKQAVSTDSWSHAILINAHASAGDKEGAMVALERMRRAGHPPCVMSYTAALKAAGGDLRLSSHLLAQMEDELSPGGGDHSPNVRAANTFLRGCLVGGGERPPRTHSPR